MPPTIAAQLSVQQQWQGPYPPPDAAERFEKLQPGTFNRLVTMAEKLQDAQIEQSKMALEYQGDATYRGQMLGGGISAVALILAAIVGWLGYPWLAGAFVAVPVMGVAKALVESARQQVAPSAPAEASVAVSELPSKERAPQQPTNQPPPEGDAPHTR